MIKIELTKSSKSALFFSFRVYYTFSNYTHSIYDDVGNIDFDDRLIKFYS